MGHEIGHYVLNHTISILIMTTLLIVIVFALANMLFNSAEQRRTMGRSGRIRSRRACRCCSR